MKIIFKIIRLFILGTGISGETIIRAGNLISDNSAIADHPGVVKAEKKRRSSAMIIQANDERGRV